MSTVNQFHINPFWSYVAKLVHFEVVLAVA